MKLCMIGTRGHNGYVFDGLARMPEVCVVGVSAGTDEDRPDDLAKWCDTNGHVPQVQADWRRMLDTLAPDIVSIAGPFDRHAEMCLEAMGRGIHVFCEKPVALTLPKLAELKTAHAESNVHFAGMMGLRYDPAFYTAWKAVRDGAVGTVRLIDTRKSYRLGTRPQFYHGRETYGGTIPWVGSHAIDWIYWFAGGPFHRVYATHSTQYNRGHGGCETSAMCQFTLAGEVFASASIDYLRPASAPSHGDDRVRVAGTDGVIEVRDGVVYLVNGDADGEQTPACECGRQIFCDFVGQVAGQCAALLNADDTFAVTEACLLARQSADDGHPIDFDDKESPS